jgi:hypothetical protein
MKTLTTRSLFMATLILSLTFSSCKKESKANDSTNTKDANGVSNAVDATSDDATALAGQVAGIAGKTTSGGWFMLCGSTVVDTGDGHTITVTYDGSTVCNGVKRTGTVVVTLAAGSTSWAQAGAVVNVAINNVKVIDATTGNSFTLNGNHTITNVTGGLAWTLWWNAPSGTIVKHRDQSSNMSVTFSDGTNATWNVDRTRTWSLNNGVITFSVSTDHNNGEDTWGTNRYGEQFNTNIATPISANNANIVCYWRPFQGKYVYNVPSRSATASILFGTNSSGGSVGTPTNCAPGYYLTYNLSNYNYTLNLYLPYW